MPSRTSCSTTPMPTQADPRPPQSTRLAATCEIASARASIATLTHNLSSRKRAALSGTHGATPTPSRWIPGLALILSLSKDARPGRQPLRTASSDANHWPCSPPPPRKHKRRTLRRAFVRLVGNFVGSVRSLCDAARAACSSRTLSGPCDGCGRSPLPLQLQRSAEGWRPATASASASGARARHRPASRRRRRASSP